VFTSLANECDLLDASVSLSATDTEQAVDRSGWMTSHVLVVKQTLLSVEVVMDGEVATVITFRTSQYHVVLNLYEVSHFTVTVFCVSVRCCFCV